MNQLLLFLALVFSSGSISAQDNTASDKGAKGETGTWREQRKKLEDEGWTTVYDSDTGEKTDSAAGGYIRVSMRWRWIPEDDELDKDSLLSKDQQKTFVDEPEQQLAVNPIADTIEMMSDSGTPGRPDIRLLADPESMELTILLDEVVFRNITILRGDTELFMSWVRGKETKLDISFLPPGIYTLRLEGFGGIEERNFVKR